MFHSLDHPRFGIIPAVRTVVEVDKDSELLCLYEHKFHEGAPWYQDLWKLELDLDRDDVALGTRSEGRTPKGQPIQPMIRDSELYKKFIKYAVDELKLQTVA